ncbi:MAG: peptide chain release factor N(5)-glutamine methyltransferase [Candidatus Omnitrophica bacterium]|nr:peptide chain release factor N(5)-glutamine methyltransferase [Candidatus Omnitrophota bacterium]
MRALLGDLAPVDLKFIIEKGFNLDFHKFLEKRRLNSFYQKRLREIIRERQKNKPLEYILKKACFFGLDLYIDERVFIPRPETELLVETFLEFTEKKKELSVLDVGTGSANISICIALFKPSFRVFSVDISNSALEVAKKNASLYKLRNLFLVNSDLLSCFKENSFDIIISNPPYVESSYIEGSESLKVEPREALDGGEDGLVFIRKILNVANPCLKKEGLLFLEIGYNQKDKVLACREGKNYRLLSIVKDYAGIERVVVFKSVKG